MLDISIKTIPHCKQRYETVGDYFDDPSFKAIVHQGRTIGFGHLGKNIRVSSLCKSQYEMLVAVHELIEMFLVEHQRVPLDVIDNFDMTFEANRKEGDLSEPGDDPNAPYFDAHQFATKIEKMMAEKLGVVWSEYEAAVNALSQKSTPTKEK